MDKIRATFFRNNSEIVQRCMQMGRLLDNSTYTKYQQFIKEKENKKEDLDIFNNVLDKIWSLSTLLLPDSLLTFAYQNELISIQLVDTVASHILLDKRKRLAYNRVTLINELTSIAEETLNDTVLIEFTHNAMSATTFNDNIKAYAEAHNLNYINKLKQLKEKSYTELIHRFHNEDIVLQLFSGFAYDMKHDIFIVNEVLALNTGSVLNLKDLFFLLKPNVWGTKEELITKVNTAKNYLKEILEKLEIFNLYQIELNLTETLRRTAARNLEQKKCEIIQHMEALSSLIQQQESLTDRLYVLENKETTFEITPTISQLTKEGLIHHTAVADGILYLYWNPLPITFFDENRLQRSYQNIVSSSRYEAIQKIVKGELFLYTLPFRTEIILSTMDIRTSRHILTPNSILCNYTSDNRYNRHPLFHNGRGCLGSFEVPFAQAKQEHNWKMLLYLLKQFYQSITIGDPLGNDACRYLFICDKDGNIVATEGNPIHGLNIIEECKKGM